MNKIKLQVLPTVKRFNTVIILGFIICNAVFAQNITNTLGTSGVFSLKHSSTTFLDLNQSDSTLDVNYRLRLPASTTSSGTGVLYKGTNRFLHNYGTSNTFLGINSGNFTMTGSSNTALGLNSLISNTSGNNNTSIGYQTLNLNSTGSYNCAFGYEALLKNTIGTLNVGLGFNALYNNITGDENTAIGTASLESNKNGYWNTAIGSYSLYSNLSTQNTAIGFWAGRYITTGFNNIAIGSDAQVPSNTGNHQIRLGNTSITYAGIQVAWTVTSDRNLKSNILNSNLGLGFISKLRPVSYTRKNNESGKTEYGLIAQEVESALQEEGVENNGMLTITDAGEYQLRYNDLLAPMIKAIQELKQENDELKKRIETLEVKNIQLSNNK